MLIRLTLALACSASCLSVPIFAETLSRARWAEVDLASVALDDLARPHGKTRWQLESLALAGEWVRAIETDADGTPRIRRTDRREGSGPLAVSSDEFNDPAGGDAAVRWLLPHRDPDLLETTPTTAIVFDRANATGTDHFWVRARRIGIGWLHLPSGPREVVLQEALVLRRDAAGRAWRPHRLIHRWVDPRAGIVAEVWGQATPDGAAMIAIDGAAVVQELLAGTEPLKIYTDELDPPILGRVTYGFDRGDGTSVSTLTPEAPADMGTLVALGTWDLSGNNLTSYPGMTELGSTTTTVSGAETCNAGECGMPNGATLGREDKDFDDPPNAAITITTLEREARPADETIWIRAAVRNEGQPGFGVSGESRLCYVSDGGETRTEVPLYRFSTEDANGWFMQDGDTWSSDQNPATPEPDAFDCENNIFFQGLNPCNCGIFCNQWIAGCTDTSCGGGVETFAGTQATNVVAEGPLTLPSGHTFNSLVLKQKAEFCVFGASSCNNVVQPVRTVLWQWMVPHLGTVVRLQSEALACEEEGLTSLLETDIKFGLFPPRTTGISNVTGTTVELEWDPGLDTHRIGVPGGDDYRVYWDTDSGADSGYAFNSIDHAGQATVSGVTATISGLSPGVQYYFSVTSRSEYANPATQTPVIYESLLYPTQVAGPGTLVPSEVSAVTGAGCVPTTEVQQVTVDKLNQGGDIEICWQPVIDTCVDGYRILGATSPESSSNFSVLVADTGLVTCQQLAPADRFFLVGGKGPGGIGPLGHFGQ